jgi:hypothetical protein
MAEDYYVLIGEKEEGPFPLDVLQAMLFNGEITRQSKVAGRGWNEWIELEHVLKVNEPRPKPMSRRAEPPSATSKTAVTTPVFAPSPYAEEPAFWMGLVSILCGMGLGFWAAFSEVVVASGASESGKVVNLGLIGDRLLLGVAAVGALIFGAVMLCFAALNLIRCRLQGRTVTQFRD